jgi:hypothetical protein
MLALKCVARNFRYLNATRCFISTQSRAFFNASVLFTEFSSPEASPVKVVAKKKRRISSSSEDEKQPEKAEKDSPKVKK